MNLKLNNPVLFVVLFAAGLLLIIILLKTCSGSTDTTMKATDSLFYWKNRAGDLAASLKDKEAAFGIADKKWKDSIAKVYATKPKFIKEVVTVTVEGQADITPTGPTEKEYEPLQTGNPCPPQVKSMSQQFNNSYYKASVRVGDNPRLVLTSYDTLTLVWKRVKEGGLFKRKNSLQLDISSANPYNKITGVQAYRVPERKQKKVGLGVQLGYGYDGNKFRPYLGAGISFNIIRL